MTGKNLSRRADYTHKYNLGTGRHGWLRLTPAYSVKVVEELIGKYDRPVRIFDPFCGTGTTALSAAYHGHKGFTTDINPFLVWLGQTKTSHYSQEVVEASRYASKCALSLVETGEVEAIAAPSIHNIERWWSPPSLDFLCRLRGAIDAVSEEGSQERQLLLIAFCRVLIALSNAAFNHQSMSFKDSTQLPTFFDVDMSKLYSDEVEFVLLGALENPEGVGTVVYGDARELALVTEERFDCVITSPPYANRMSYIRELRPYMYWLGYLKDARTAGEIDWLSIGGTWGIATSRLNDWIPEAGYFDNELLASALDAISHQDNKNGRLLARYIEKYFVDMWKHFQSLRSVLALGAHLHYIVGNSTFYGVLLPVEQIYASMLNSLGFQSVTCHPIRKRNSKKELVEFDVTAVWRG